MNELIALLVFAILSLAWQLISDEPWTRINRRAEMVAAGVASLGRVVERVLSNPTVPYGDEYWEIGQTTNALILLDVIDSKVARLDIGVFKRAEETELWGKPNRPHLKYKVRIFFTTMENGRELLGAKAGLMGTNLLDTLAAFTGHAFTPQEIAGLEIKQ